MSEFKPVVTKKLLLPLLNEKMQLDTPLYIKLTSEIYNGVQGEGSKKAARLCHATNLMTGEEGKIIVASIVESTILDSYPAGEYVGKGFGITKHEKPEGSNQRYFPYTIDELQLPNG